MKWYHHKCSDSISAQTFWSCNLCRCLPEQVLSLRDQISELNQTISNLVNNQNDFYSKICEISQDNSKLLAENKYLRKQLYEYRLQSYNSLSSSDESSSSSSDSDSDDECKSSPKVIIKKNKTKCNPKAFTRRNTAQSKNTIISGKSQSSTIGSNEKKPKLTVVGCSMVRDTGRNISSKVRDYNTCVLSKSGFTIEDASKQIRDITQDYNKNDIIVLQVGTNNVSNSSLEDLKEKYSVLIQNTKQAVSSSTIIVSALPNRISPASAQVNKNINMLNKFLRNMCEQDEQCFFADCNPQSLRKNFKFDGYHFSKAGSSDFVTALSLFINENFPCLNIQQVK